MFITPLLFTISSVVSYSILNYITYSITSFFSLRIRPYILKKIDTNTIVERERYTTVEKQFFELDTKYTNEKANFLRNIETVEQLTKENNELSIEITNKQEEIDNIKIESREKTDALTISLNSELEQLRKELKVKESEIYKLKVDSVLKTSEIEPSALFAGKWEKSFLTPDNRPGKEQFTISGDKYIIDGKEYFDILYVRLFANKRFIELKKVSTLTKGELINKLIKVSDTHFIGTENDNIRVEYKKIQ